MLLSTASGKLYKQYELDSCLFKYFIGKSSDLETIN